jgi:peptidoglycan/LPS O-acetylase OafA/YrhL
MTYRSDIDGLRAIAVIAVILFHLNPDSFSSGFLGVDIFFVISGFLITAVIDQKITKVDFSFKEFYIRRLRRLYPVLLTVVTVTVIVAVILLYGSQRKVLGDSAISAIFAFSNIHHLIESQDYWNPSTKNMALIHTWSLSVEEQFYLVFPLVFFWISRREKLNKNRLLIFSLVAIISYAAYLSHSHTGERFYLTHFRIWEFSIGSITYFLSIKKRASLLIGDRSKLVAVGALLIGLYLGFETTFLSELNALIILVASAIILYVAPAEGTWAQKLLTSAPARYTGKISYSLYLWHWPVIVFSRSWFAPNYPLELALTFTLAVLSYSLVENKCRYKNKPFIWYSSSVTLVLVISLITLNNVKTPILVPEHIQPIIEEDTFKKGSEYEMLPTLRGWKADGAPKLEPSYDMVLLGSSHARIFAKEVDLYCLEKGFNFLNLSASGLGVTSETPTKRLPDAKQLNQFRFELLKNLQIERVIVAGRWDDEARSPQFAQLFKANLTKLKGLASSVSVLGQSPAPQLAEGYKKDLRQFIIHKQIKDEFLTVDEDSSVAAVNERVRELCEEAGVVFISIDYQRVSPNLLKTSHAGQFIYADYNHLNAYGARCAFKENIRPMLDQSK